jgi:PAS domain S-box-containing protein
MQLIGHRNVIGLPVRQALPEIEGQGFFELLDGVYSTGQPFVGRGLTAYIQRSPGAAREERFLDLIYQPVRDPNGNVVGIFVEGADVTDGIVAREDLRASKEQFELFAEAMPNHVWTAKPDGTLDWFNHRVFEYSGLDSSALEGTGWTSMVHPDDIAAAAERWTESLRTGRAYETEFRLRSQDGAYRWHLARAVGLHDAQGRVSRWIGTNTDIDDQKKISQQLLESEARLSLAIGAGQLAVWDYDIAGARITSSPALNKLFGFPADANPSPEDYRGRYAPGEAERLAQIGRDAMLAGGSELEAEVRVLWPDATEKWLLIRAQLFDAGRRAIGVVIDTTQRKQAEQELAQSELRFRLSQQAAGIASLELDIATGTVIGSEHFWEIWGLPKLEQVNISVLENIVLPEFRNVRSTPETREAGTATPSVEYRILRPDNGELRWLSRHIEFVHDDAGRPIKMFGIMQDITDRHEAQARQELLTHELEHRIKNILAMVSAIASQTLRNTDLETAAANFSERLAAVSTAHDIMARTRWTSAGLSEVVTSAMSPFPQGQISISGPDVALAPKKALTLALAVNELGTNAMKYGAFSQDTGRVEVEWALRDSEQEHELIWTWRESGGPPVTAPARRGFGRFLVERVFAADFGGTVSVEYLAQGIVCTLVAPMPELSQPGKVA